MKIKRIYNDNEGKSHFGEVTINLKDGGPIGLLSEKFSADKIIFLFLFRDILINFCICKKFESYSVE